MKTKLLFLITLLTIAMGANALSVRSHHPKRYVVKEGDTLWSIADQFLDKPWEWELIWKHNPHIKNPNQLYPGAIIEFHDNKGRPYLSLARRASIRLSPKIRKRRLPSPIPPVPVDILKPFLNYSLVFEDQSLRDAPYIIGFSDNRLVGADDSHIFATLLKSSRNQSYAIFRRGKPYRHPKTTQRLGYRAIHIADAKVVKAGDPATLVPTKIVEDIHVGDNLILKRRQNLFLDFYPHPPRVKVNGQIISIFGGLEHGGNCQVVVITQGRDNGLRCGDVLAVMRPGKKIVDPVLKRRRIKLPDERVAHLMVFRTFHKVSFAVSMKTWSPIKNLDLVVNP